jgi:GNAT superfamily N-acetyltransferase
MSLLHVVRHKLMVMNSEPTANRVDVRPFTARDQVFLARVTERLYPGPTVSPRDPDVLRRFFDDLAKSRLLNEPETAVFVGTINAEPAGIIAVHPDADYFTGHPRAYVDILVVGPEAEGQGVGRALLQHVEGWARARGFREVVLDVFAGNEGATAFYERCGYRPDHVRMAKPLR